ncbi:hypothetical protein [uncultured Pantoea sp.]|uniref:hypothetical protein n=1 Tax=uncultured Pantoea sp. TaxID=218084 RepID=UPI00258F5BC6|nr:hypothetical protein [uncultured Pantoea sp.]
MKGLIILLLTLLSSSCSSEKVLSTAPYLSDKVRMASESNDSSTLSDDDYDQITAYLSQGRWRWIAFYPILKQSPFLGATSFQEGLDIAMAYALPENPEMVLKFVNQSNVNKLCNMPFIEPTPDERERYFLQTRAALNRLTTRKEWGEKCLAVLENNYKTTQEK